MGRVSTLANKKQIVIMAFLSVRTQIELLVILAVALFAPQFKVDGRGCQDFLQGLADVGQIVQEVLI